MNMGLLFERTVTWKSVNMGLLLERTVTWKSVNMSLVFERIVTWKSVNMGLLFERTVMWKSVNMGLLFERSVTWKVRTWAIGAWGAGIFQWLEHRIRDRKVVGLKKLVGAVGEFSSVGSIFCADSNFGIRSSLCYRSST